jgi:glycosyltransferase involved in cell wall biosynthesis
MNTLELSIVIPCLDEAATIARCVSKACAYLTASGIAGEVVVADNGSSDGSRERAQESGARVVLIAEKGYGSALRGGIAAAHGRFVIVGDADESYDFGRLDAFIAKLREGYELVMGNRFQGGIEAGAMPLLHRYVGNPVLSFIGRLFFKTGIRDFHCGLRGFRREAIERIDLRTSGMEFASEMVVKAALAGLRMTEVPTTLSLDRRGRPSHLRTWRDGWRHLRFLLTFSPRWLFLYPGLALLFVGVALQAGLLHGGLRLGSIGLGVHTMLYSAAMSIIGVQMVWFAVLTKVYGIRVGLLPQDARIEQTLRALTLERGIAIGCALLIGGIALSAGALHSWADANYGALNPLEVMRTAIPSVSMMIMGMEFVVASFFLGMLRLEHPGRTEYKQHSDDASPRAVRSELPSNIG